MSIAYGTILYLSISRLVKLKPAHVQLHMLQSDFQSQHRKYQKQLKKRLNNKPQNFYAHSSLNRQAQLASASAWKTVDTWTHTTWGHEHCPVAEHLPESPCVAPHKGGACTHQHRSSLQCSLFPKGQLLLSDGATHQSAVCYKENAAHISHMWLKRVLAQEWGFFAQEKGVSYCLVEKHLLQHCFVWANYEISLASQFPQL